ncbi:FAD-dependent oxidoreductase [Streptomyces harbinensis]|uniref:FAD-dependent oxidoreductase n=1 Tax=Streptomyces harbinensis TaxID=1176198 RepID=UPI0034DDEB71
MTDSGKILVVGGGIAGLTMSICLDMAGFESEVYEAYPVYKEAGSSFVLVPSGQEVLASMGILEEVRENSFTAASSTRFFTSENEVIGRMEWNQSAPGTRELLSIGRAELLNVLLAEAKRRKIRVNYGKKLYSVVESPHDVKAVFEDGTATHGTLLIGADGTKSRTRSLIFPHIPLKYSGVWCVFGKSSPQCLPGDELAALRTSMNSYEGRTATCFVTYDGKRGHQSISWILVGTVDRKIPAKSFEQKPRGALRSELLTLVQGWKGAVPTLIKEANTLTPVQLNCLDALPAWSSGRIALIGDAIHAASPLLGLGATFALGDAMYLSKMLREHDYPDAYYYYHLDRHAQLRSISTQQAFTLGASATLFDFGQSLPAVDWDGTDNLSLLNPPQPQG